MTIKTQAYLQGYLSEKTAAVPRDRVDDTPTQVTEGRPLTPEEYDSYVYKNQEEEQKDRRGYANYRALETAAKAGPTVGEDYAQWKLKNTPEYTLSHILSPDAAKNIRIYNKILPYRIGGRFNMRTKGLFMNAYQGNKGNDAINMAHELVHGRQAYDRDQLPWYSPRRRGNPLARFLDDWLQGRDRKKQIGDKVKNILGIPLVQKETEHRAAGSQDLRRAGIPPSRFAGDKPERYLTYASNPIEAQAFAESESWGRGRNMAFTYPGVPQWYNDIIRDKGEEAAILEFRRRRALKASKILADRSVQEKIEPSGGLKDQTFMTYAADPWDIKRRGLRRKGILKLLEDPNSPFREKLLQAGWGNVTHGLPNADEGKQ